MEHTTGDVRREELAIGRQVLQGAGQPAGALAGTLQGLGDHALTEVAEDEKPHYTDVGHQQDGKEQRRGHQAPPVGRPRTHGRFAGSGAVLILFVRSHLQFISR